MRKIAPTLALALAIAACREERADPAAAAAVTTAEDGTQRVAIRVTDKGFEPAEVKLRQGAPGILEFTRETDSECLNAVKMPWADAAVDLPKGEKVAIAIPDMSKAGQFTYACWMNMIFGRVVIEPR